MTGRNRMLKGLAAVLVLIAAPAALAQTPRDGRLIVTVVDQTGGVLPGATVTIGGMDDGNRAATIHPATANEQGVATFAGLRPGRYALRAEFSGFDPRVDPDVRVRAGDNKQTMALALEKDRTSDV